MPAVIINGTYYSHGSIEVEIRGITYPGVTAINYKDELSPGHLWATGPHKIGRTPGKANPSATCEMYRAYWDVVRRELGQRFGLAVFDVFVIYAERSSNPGEGGLLVMDQLEQCRITAVEPSSTEGNEPLTVRLTLDPMRIKWGHRSDNSYIESPGATLPTGTTETPQDPPPPGEN